MDRAEITIHGPIAYGHDRTAVACPTCRATHSHTVRGQLDDAAVPVTLTCVNGHSVPIPDQLDHREFLFTVAMRAE
ncbi:hypothetical protein ABZX75_17330 [Streptomyces sp. NPDC003038]|uniref:hypothetical protein n=1 Tax=unclassified Streptomyces TaxID=2593676 RepID=UPI0033B750C8